MSCLWSRKPIWRQVDKKIMKILKELSNQVQVCLTQDFFYLINIIVQLNTKSLPNVYLVVNVFSDPLWTIDVQNLSMCNAAVNAFWSSARIDAEKKRNSRWDWDLPCSLLIFSMTQFTKLAIHLLIYRPTLTSIYK